MNKKLLSVALLSLSFSSFAALAEQDCSKMDSTGGVYDCVQKNKDESEVALNKAYGEAKKKSPLHTVMTQAMKSPCSWLYWMDSAHG